ncbi:3-hydroxyacyl-CoA dehydrogenase NAD-binding domain-containing protein [Alteromonas gilva]|uniref:3-hydroxyacyl-CoA dehydrogenase NAD-binding domain-containing protein n=1 Tax=Alteromonas gilva TaxID=2987522 RepID=A0ABT5L177_9ALTE|nr:3-hydroxyacyl-CoA dehydrogenase NAD-binding domain-containing protein [Alteromonas gilva]MDC8830151.1 3-hydroxyacyl-CoA dehydrogenase NAD-binding domain-containing protein [Alteromonas gilva]
MTSAVTMNIVDNIAVIEVDNPPVNALSFAVRSGLQSCVREAEQHQSVEAIVLSCRGKTFIAGADITEFGKPMQPPALPDLLADMDTISKPIVAALHGTALGGGLEVALTCHYRVALASAKVGLPEVLLGLLPGAGGTQRLPRIAGVELALDMITSGRKVSSTEAAKAGLVDKVVDGDLLDNAIAFAKQVVADGQPLKRISDMTATVSDPAVFDEYRAKLAKTRRGFDAPQYCVDVVQAAVECDFAEGCKKERELFLKLMTGTQSQAQRHLFFAERQAGHVVGLDKATPTREVNSVAIIGAGTMGSGIAINFLNKGMQVTLLEMSLEALERGIEHIYAYYDGQVNKGRITQDQADASKALLSGTDAYAELDSVDLVIEAVFENMGVKKDVFTKLDKYCKPGAILASNTSTLNIDTIASFTSRPEDVIGLHFFSPANIMRLLEVVRGEKTADDVMATAMKLAKDINKIGVVSGVCDGFIGNRMLKGYGREAGALLLDGVAPVRIDKALYDFGMAMGPLTMGDLAGLDVGYRVRKERRERGDDVPVTDGAIADRLVEAGRLGQKAGKGYYHYEAGSRTPIPDPEVDEIIQQAMAALNRTAKDISDEEIVKRLIYPLINEAALILDEGIAQRPSDIDVVYIYGYGFPVYRGGPMFYADTVGLKNIVADMEDFKSRYGDDWEIAPLLKQLAEQGRKFADLAK